MNVEDLGDVVFAAHAILDDGSMPAAQAGSRGVIVMKGYHEEEPTRTVFLVSFEDKELNLGNPIGCWAEDLTTQNELQ